AAAARVLTVERGDGGLRCLLGLHLHEAEPLGPAGVAIHDHLRGLHRAVRLEHPRQVSVSHPVAEVADAHFPTHSFSPLMKHASRPTRTSEAEPTQHSPISTPPNAPEHTRRSFDIFPLAAAAACFTAGRSAFSVPW